MIKNCQNLSWGQQGANIQYLCLHAQTHQQLQYCVKHAHGVSLEYNESTPDHSWYGAGQGAGDATIQWAVLSHSLLTAYKTQAHLWQLTNPTKTISISQGINTFDTALMDINTSLAPQTEDMIATTQSNLNMWNGLLESSRGALNPDKCTWAHFYWQEQNDPINLTIDNNNTSSSNITIPWLGQLPQPITKLKPYQPYKYLQVHVTMNGDWKKESATLKNWNQKYMLIKPMWGQSHLPAVLHTHCHLPTTCNHHPNQKDQQRTKTNHDSFPGKNGIPSNLPASSGICT